MANMAEDPERSATLAAIVKKIDARLPGSAGAIAARAEAIDAARREQDSTLRSRFLRACRKMGRDFNTEMIAAPLPLAHLPPPQAYDMRDKARAMNAAADAAEAQTLRDDSLRLAIHDVLQKNRLHKGAIDLSAAEQQALHPVLPRRFAKTGGFTPESP